MKILTILLIMPFFSIGQTVHVKNEKIMYEGTEKISGVSASEIFSRIQKVLPVSVSNYRVDKQSSNIIEAEGQFKLNTPYSVIRKIAYRIQINARENGYDYTIDSVMLMEQSRGEKAITKSSKELLENMGEAGKIVGDTEKILDETDMRIQELLDKLRNKISKE